MIDLTKYQDLKYREFQSKIIVTKYHYIGIRMPILRKLGKTISEEELRMLPLTYERVLLEGMQVKKVNDKKAFIDAYLPKIDSWSVCDTFCNNLEFIKKDLDYYYDYLISLLDSNDEYKIRFAVVVFLKYYINNQYVDKIVNRLKKVSFHAYYSDMAIAWFLAESYCNYPSLVEKHLSAFSIDIQKMAKKKIKESLKIPKRT